MRKKPKHFLSLFPLFLSCFCFGQPGKMRIFKVTEIISDSPVIITHMDTIRVEGKLEFDFYRRNFYEPSFPSRAFFTPRFRNENVTEWNDSPRKDDNRFNWRNIYRYDSLSRMTEWMYTGCLVCANLPFHWFIYYDQQNRPVRMENAPNYGYPTNIYDHSFHLKKGQIIQSVYIFEYDGDGNLTGIKKFFDRTKLELAIEMQ